MSYERQPSTLALQAARRASRQAGGEPQATAAARRAVQAAKEALGERGPVWWQDGAPDWGRYLVKNTPFADWYRGLAAEDV